MATPRVMLCLGRKLFYSKPDAACLRPLAKTHTEAGCGGLPVTWETKAGELPDTQG